MVTSSIYDDASDADGYLGADEKVGLASLMDGHNSENEPLDEEEYSGEGENPSEDDNNADDNDSDGNSSDESDGPLDYATMCKALGQFKDTMIENGIMANTINTLKRKVRDYKNDAEYYKHEAKRMGRTQKQTEDLTRQLGCLLKQKRDYDAIEAERDVTKEANKRLRLELDETKAQSQKEWNEKADYQRIKEERTEYHRQLKEKTGNCTALEKQVAELRRKLDVEASFAARTMAMFSTKPEI